jgi:hypothetical protein
MPTRKESEGGWHKWRGIPYWPTKPLISKWSRKLGFMCVITIAPELVVGLAIRQFLDARTQWKRTGKKYTIAHAFYADIGGFVLRVYDPIYSKTKEVKHFGTESSADAVGIAEKGDSNLALSDEEKKDWVMKE